ncbi:MAG: MFS transporter [Leptospiraceae bacterium]|nr:MAG: MFS transporter [Leptospiraceae bacterium]
MLRTIPLSVYYITIARMLLAFGYTMSYVFIPVYLYQIKHLSAGIVGTITGLSTLFGLTGWIPASTLIQKLGEKKLMVYSFLIRAFNFLFIGCIIYFDLNYFFLIPFLLLNSFLMGISVSPMESFLLNMTDHNNRNIAVSIHRTGMNIGWAFGPFIGGILAEKHFALPFAGTFFLTLAAVILIFFKIHSEESKPSNSKKYISFQSLKIFLSNKLFLFFSINSLNLFILMSLLITPLSVFLTGHYNISKTDLGKLYLLNGLMVGFLQIPISLWFKNLYFSIQTGLALYFIGYLSIGIFAEMNFFHQLLYISIIIITLGEILSVSPVHTVSSFFAKENSQLEDSILNGYVSSFIGFIRSFGWSIGPIIAGWIQDWFHSPLLIWLLSASFGIIGILVFQILFYFNPSRFNNSNT